MEFFSFQLVSVKTNENKGTSAARNNMESDLICNFKNCRKALKDCAWVTSCSHVFCNEDGAREFQKSLLCPACESSLPGKYDIIRMELNPCEQYKSMILAGLGPDIIMDICSRAMSFWSYQVQQELSYQLHNVSKLTERCSRLEQIYEQAAVKAKAENLSLKKDIEASKQERENQKKHSSELVEKLAEKNRQLQKVHAMYETLRRKCFSPAYCDKNVVQRQPQREAQAFSFPLTTMEDISGPAKMPAMVSAAAKDGSFLLVQDSSGYVPPENFNFMPTVEGRNFSGPHDNGSPPGAQFSVNFATTARNFK